MVYLDLPERENRYWAVSYKTPVRLNFIVEEGSVCVQNPALYGVLQQQLVSFCCFPALSLAPTPASRRVAANPSAGMSMMSGLSTSLITL